MKIAIFHNFLDNIGGAEMVTFILARELGADIYTTNIDNEKIKKMGFSDILPRIYSIGKVPLNAPFRQQSALWKFSRLNLENKYGFYIISGDWAISSAKHNKPNLWYAHSPVREIWPMYEFARNNIVGRPIRLFFDAWVFINRRLIKKYAKKAGAISCNSELVRQRIKNIFGRNSAVINPPVGLSDFKFGKTGNYWLSVNRLLETKRVDFQLKAFSKIPHEKLIIVGSYEKAGYFKKYADYCRKIKPANVEIISWIAKDELVSLYANCKGLITTSKDEDFGMNAIEAMASGKPVIAPNEGGYMETIISGKTGILIDDVDENKIALAVKQISRELKENPEKYMDACIRQAKKFDTSIFVEKIKEIIYAK